MYISSDKSYSHIQSNTILLTYPQYSEIIIVCVEPMFMAFVGNLPNLRSNEPGKFLLPTNIATQE